MAVASAHALAAEGAEKLAKGNSEKYDTETRRNTENARSFLADCSGFPADNRS